MAKSIRLLFGEAEDNTSLSTSNEIDDSVRLVKLSVKIGGPKQAGLSEAWMDGRRLFKDKVGSFTKEPIKTNAELNGKTLNVYTVVTDSIEEDENHTEVKYDLTGGVGEVHTTLSKKVSQQGDSVYYEFEVFFFKI
jgi:hypothetical protein